MGKFSTPVSRLETTFHPDLIQDISAQLSGGRKVFIIYDESKISRQRASSILKKIPTDDVYRVLLLSKEDFDFQKAKSPELKNSYQISLDEFLRYSPNILPE